MNRTFITIAAFVIAAMGVVGAFDSYRVSLAYSEQYPDAYGAERSLVRFAALAERVPASAELGYFTDVERSATAYPPAFLAAQFALAPRELIVLDGHAQPEWAVGNFSKPTDFAAAGEAKGYALVADLGDGVVLFRRK